jgi:hypothetical protein
VNSKTFKKNWNPIVGLILIIINLYWIWDNLYRCYLQHYSDILFIVMLPDWALYFNAAIGLFGIANVIGIIKLKIKIKTGILGGITILTVGLLLKMLVVM